MDLSSDFGNIYAVRVKQLMSITAPIINNDGTVKSDGVMGLRALSEIAGRCRELARQALAHKPAATVHWVAHPTLQISRAAFDWMLVEAFSLSKICHWSSGPVDKARRCKISPCAPLHS